MGGGDFLAYILIDNDDRVVAMSDDHLGDNEIEVEFPDDFETRPFKKCFYKDGEIVYDNSVYILVDENNRVTAISDFHIDETKEIEIEFDNQFDPSDYENYLYQNGEFVYSEKPIPTYEQILTLKANLDKTDYIVAKIAEAQVTGRALPEEDATRYADILIQREQWRAQINELEAQMEEV